MFSENVPASGGVITPALSLRDQAAGAREWLACICGHIASDLALVLGSKIQGHDISSCSEVLIQVP